MRLGYQFRKSPKTQRVLLFALHGLTRTKEDFYQIESILPPDIAFLSIDLPYHGDSIDISCLTLTNLFDLIEDVFHACNISIKDPMIGFGTSMGGIIIELLCVFDRIDCQKIIFNDIAPIFNQEGILKRLDLREFITQFASYEEAKCFYLSLVKGYGPFPPEAQEKLFKAYIVERQGLYCFAFSTDIQIFLKNIFEYTPHMEKFWKILQKKAPKILVIHAFYSDILTEYEIQRLKYDYPALECYSIPDVGHAPFLFENKLKEKIVQFIEEDAHR